MHLIENYQPVLMICKIQFGLCKLRAILLGFKVEIERVDGLANLKSKSSLANLARPKQGNCRRVSKRFR